MDAKESWFVHVTRTYSRGRRRRRRVQRRYTEETKREREREREREKYRTSDGGFKGNEGRKEREDR